MMRREKKRGEQVCVRRQLSLIEKMYILYVFINLSTDVGIFSIVNNDWKDSIETKNLQN